MAIRKLVIYPDLRLKKKCPPLEMVGELERAEFDDMIDSMKHYDGVGLASVQIGIMKQMFVVNMDYLIERYTLPHAQIGKVLCCANAEVLYRSDDIQKNDEGCLSLPGISCSVERPLSIKVKYIDYDSQEQELEATGMLAACILHEIDHTKGTTILDYQSPLRKKMLEKKIKVQGAL